MFEPRIVCFFCKWCTYAGADLAGTSRKQYPPNGVVVRVNCSGRIDPQHVLWAFREGADGVLIGGCHPGDCHYQDGNYKTMRRVAFLRRMLEDMGVDPKRLHLEWISAAEGEKLVHVMNDFVDSVKELGPMEVELAGGGRLPATPPAQPVKKAKAKPKKKTAGKAKAKPKKKAAKKAAKKAKAKPKKKAAAKKAKAKPRKKAAKKAKAKPKKKAAKKAKAKPKKKAAKKAAKKAKAKPKKKTAKKAKARPKKKTKKTAKRKAASRKKR